MAAIAWGVVVLLLVALTGNWAQIALAVSGFALLGAGLTIVVAVLTARPASFPAFA